MTCRGFHPREPLFNPEFLLTHHRPQGRHVVKAIAVYSEDRPILSCHRDVQSVAHTCRGNSWLETTGITTGANAAAAAASLVAQLPPEPVLAPSPSWAAAMTTMTTV